MFLNGSPIRNVLLIMIRNATREQTRCYWSLGQLFAGDNSDRMGCILYSFHCFRQSYIDGSSCNLHLIRMILVASCPRHQNDGPKPATHSARRNCRSTRSFCRKQCTDLLFKYVKVFFLTNLRLLTNILYDISGILTCITAARSTAADSCIEHVPAYPRDADRRVRRRRSCLALHLQEHMLRNARCLDRARTARPV